LRRDPRGQILDGHPGPEMSISEKHPSLSLVNWTNKAS
jgi:hypothetical protein